MKARGAAVPIPIDVVTAKTFAADAPATVKAAADVADDDLILDIGPQTAALLAAQLKRGRHHRLERPGRRVRVRRLRPRHRDHRARHRRQPAPSASPAAATRWRPSPSTASRRTWATSPPAAAPSWKCWKARPCRPSRSCRSAPPADASHACRARSRCGRGALRLPLRSRRPQGDLHEHTAMPRATKIVATLGPASSDARGAGAHDPRRRRRGAAELLARHGAGPHRPRRRWCATWPQRPARRSRSWPTCRARRSASASSKTARSCSSPAQKFVLDARAHRARRHRRASASTTRNCRAT